MRIVIPEKLLQNLQRHLILSEEVILNSLNQFCDKQALGGQKPDESATANGITKRLKELWEREGDSQAFVAELERLTDMSLWKSS